MESFVVVVECIIEHKGKFLLIKRPEGVHAGGLLAFPGGKIERADGAQDADILVRAVKREVLEEVGIELDVPVKYVTSSCFVDSQNTQVVDAVFYAQLGAVEVVVKPSEREVPEYHWLTVEGVNSRDDAPPWVRRYLATAMLVHPSR